MLVGRLPLSEALHHRSFASLLVAHLHRLGDALGLCVGEECDGEVVFGRHHKVPLHRLIPGEAAQVVGREEVGVGLATGQLGLYYCQHYRGQKGVGEHMGERKKKYDNDNIETDLNQYSLCQSNQQLQESLSDFLTDKLSVHLLTHTMYCVYAV